MSALIPSIIFAIGLFTAAEHRKPSYKWSLAAPAGSGCFQPNCEPGKFPMAVVPITGFADRLYLIGDRAVWSSDDGVNWAVPKLKTDWHERYGHRYVYFNGKLWMLGGMKTWDDFRNDVWASDDGVEWKQVVQNAPWKERRGHGAVVFDDKLWVIGGSISSGRRDRTPTEALNDVWSTADGINWKQVVANAPWTPRECHTALIFDNKIWLIGGPGMREIWSSTNGRDWTRVTENAGFGYREGGAAAVFDGKMWVYGGVEKNDVWHSTDGLRWTKAFDAAPWSTRSTTYSTVYKNRLLLFSGKTGRADTQQGEIWAMSRMAERTER